MSISFQLLIAEFWRDVQRNRILKKSSLRKHSTAAFFSSEVLITDISKCVYTYVKIYHKQMPFERRHSSTGRPSLILTQSGKKKAKLLVIFHVFTLVKKRNSLLKDWA